MLVDIISRSYEDVAQRFGIDADNAPSHPSNAKPQWLRDDMGSGVRYLVAELDGDIVACVGYRQVSPDTIEAQRLAVLPERRGSHVANQLNSAVLDAARELGAARIRISVVADHQSLRRWYVRMGFVETEARRFANLPFTVQYLEYVLDR
jgi:ribosomal protein S18 acetylase RimI-like enzyme